MQMQKVTDWTVTISYDKMFKNRQNKENRSDEIQTMYRYS